MSQARFDERSGVTFPREAGGVERGSAELHRDRRVNTSGPGALSHLLLSLPVLLALAAAAAVSGGPTAAAAAAAAAPSAAAAQPPAPPDGRMLYLRDCAYCHGEAGRGTPRGQSLTEIGPAEVDYALSTGRMPIEEPGDPRRRRNPAYDTEQIQAIVAFMRPFIAREPDIPVVDLGAGNLAEGGELYRAQCAACHQWAGQGGALLGMESPSLNKSTALQVAEVVRAGPTTMPVFGPETISDEQLNSIVRYVLSLREPDDPGGLGLYHLGPLPEGAVAWLFGMALIVIALFWIGERE